MYILILVALLVVLGLLLHGVWTLHWARKHWQVEKRLNRYCRR